MTEEPANIINYFFRHSISVLETGQGSNVLCKLRRPLKDLSLAMIHEIDCNRPQQVRITHGRLVSRLKALPK